MDRISGMGGKMVDLVVEMDRRLAQLMGNCSWVGNGGRG